MDKIASRQDSAATAESSQASGAAAADDSVAFTLGGRELLEHSLDDSFQPKEIPEPFLQVLRGVTPHNLISGILYLRNFQEYCKIKGITFFNFATMPLRSAKLFLQKCLIDEALVHIQSHRELDFDFRVFISLMNYYFQGDSNEKKKIKDSIDSFTNAISQFLPLVLGHPLSKVLKNLLGLHEKLEQFPESLSWLTGSQMTDLNKLCSDMRGKSESDLFQLIQHYIQNAEEFTIDAAVLDSRGYMRYSCEANQKAYELLASCHEKFRTQIDEAFHQIFVSLQAHLPKARLSAKAHQTHQFDSRLVHFMTRTLPKQISICMAETKNLSAKIAATTKMCKEMSVAEATPHLLKIISRMSQMDDIKEGGIFQITSLLHTLTLSSGEVKSADLDQFKRRRMSLLYNRYVITFHNLIFSSLVTLVTHEKSDDAPLSLPELENMLKRILGSLSDLFCKSKRSSQRTPAGPLEEYYSLSRTHPLPDTLITQMNRRFRENTRYIHTYDIEFLALDDSMLQQFLTDFITLHHTETYVLGFLGYEVVMKNHEKSLIQAFKRAQKKSTHPTVHEIKLELEALSEFRNTAAAAKDLATKQFYDTVSKSLERYFTDSSMGSDLFGLALEQLTLAQHCKKISEAFQLLINLHLGISRCFSGGITCCLAEPLIDQHFFAVVPSITEEDPREQERALLAEVNLKELLAEEAQKESTHKKKGARSSTVATALPQDASSTETTESAALVRTPSLPSPGASRVDYLRSLQIERSATLMRKSRLSLIEISEAHSQIYLHQSVAIASALLKHHRFSRALVLSLCESLHLSLEQQITAEGLRRNGSSLQEFYTHNLKTRLAQCQLVSHIPEVCAITSVGTYNARYPHINAHSSYSSITKDLLHFFETDQSPPPELLLKIIDQLNGALLHIQDAGEDLPTTAAYLESFISHDSPLPVASTIDVSPLIQAIETTFAPCSEKTDLLIHLEELRQICQMIHELSGLPRALVGVIQQALFRILQYSTRNLLIVMIKKNHPKMREIPVRHIDLCQIVGLPKPLEEAVVSCDMKKGLAYPLGKKDGLNLSAREKALVKAHLLSIRPEGFTFPGDDATDEDVKARIEKSLQDLEAILNDLIRIATQID